MLRLIAGHGVARIRIPAARGTAVVSSRITEGLLNAFHPAGIHLHFGEPLSEERFRKVIQHAYQQGIRTFMSADVYGNGAADTMLGEALAGDRQLRGQIQQGSEPVAVEEA